MGIRVECDWCRKVIEEGTPYVTIQIDGKIAKGHASTAEDVSQPARVYCGGPHYRDDDPATCGMARKPDMHNGPLESCGSRVLALLDGTLAGRADMGMEWRLVAMGAPKWDRLADGPLALLKVDGRIRDALANAGLGTVQEVARLTEAQWRAIPGIGHSRVAEIRKALYRHENVKPKQLQREIEQLEAEAVPA